MQGTCFHPDADDAAATESGGDDIVDPAMHESELTAILKRKLAAKKISLAEYNHIMKVVGAYVDDETKVLVVHCCLTRVNLRCTSTQ